MQDIMLEPDLFVVSDACPWFIWEMSEYRTDEKNKIIEENDHLIDDFRYILNNAYYDKVPRPTKPRKKDRRGFRMEEDRAEYLAGHDPFRELED
jgi:hypothetical protein